MPKANPQTTGLPILPPGYKWEMVHQCPHGRGTERTGGKWTIRISWEMSGGKHRMLNLKNYYFDTKDQATAYGVRVAADHAVMRKLKNEKARV